MEIFIGSSRECLNIVREVEVWLEDVEHQPLPWDMPGLFEPGEQTFQTLIKISKRVGGAIFIFSEDDKIWYRNDTSSGQPRDNVLIEYGLFAGILGLKKAIICRLDSPKQSVDLSGLTFIDISENKRSRAKLEISLWSKKLGSKPLDPAILLLQGKVGELERKLEKINNKLSFEEDKTNDLSQILTEKDIVDFTSYDLAKDGHWKLLFEYDYFNFVANTLAKSVKTPIELKELLKNSNADKIVHLIAWHSPGYSQNPGNDLNPERNFVLSRKALRVFRHYATYKDYIAFISSLPLPIRVNIEKAGELEILRLKKSKSK